MRRNVLFYCCHGDRLTGHTGRAALLAERLTSDFDVTILTDDPPLRKERRSRQIFYVSLPRYRVDPDSPNATPEHAGSIERDMRERRNRILDAYERLRPRIVIFDSFPFSLQKRRPELLPLIERVHHGVFGKALTVCVTDAIISGEESAERRRGDRAAALLGRYFDLILICSDPVFARVEEFVTFPNTLQTPLYHTGFISPGALQFAAPLRRGQHILVSAGDGRYGRELFRCAIEAQPRLWAAHGRPMKLVAGAHLPASDWRDLGARAEGVPGLSLVQGVESLRVEMAQAGCSVSQCTYESMLDTITTETPALFVPYQHDNYREQLVRAERAVSWGAGILLPPHRLDEASFAGEVENLLAFVPRRIRFNQDGLDKSISLIGGALAADDFPTTFANILPPGIRPD